jgi:hypothetical protein
LSNPTPPYLVIPSRVVRNLHGMAFGMALLHNR